jgi:hypothetical protein
MRVRDSFDVPEEILAGPMSPAFEKFLWNWFADTRALTHGELDLSFLQELTPAELATARSLIRRNLRLGMTHIIQGAAALRDLEAVPELRRLLEAQPDTSRRLVIAGALWNLIRDPVFVECLRQARDSESGLMWGPGLARVLWLDDERALDFLIDVTGSRGRYEGTAALGLLNDLEFGRPIRERADSLPMQRADYRRRQSDPAFRQHMTAAIRKRNRELKTGVAFGWSEVPGLG